jgi:hypothetical protein
MLDVTTFEAARAQGRRPGRGDHAAAVHHGPVEAAALSVPFVAEGLERDEAVFLQLSADAWDETATRMGADSERVTWVDADGVYLDGFAPGEAVARVRGMAEASERPVRLVGGLPPTFADQVPVGDLRRYERLAHDLAVRLGITALCLYDADTLPAEYLEVERRVHPLVQAGGALVRNPDFAWEPA